MLFGSQPFRKGGLSNESEGVDHELQFLRRSDTRRQHVLSRMRCSTGRFRIERLCPTTSNHAAAQSRHSNLPWSTANLRPRVRANPTNATGQQHATNGPDPTRHASRHGARSAPTAKPSSRNLPSATSPGRLPSQPIPTSTTAGQRNAHARPGRRERHAKFATGAFAEQRSAAHIRQRKSPGARRHENRTQPSKFTHRCHGQPFGRSRARCQRRAPKSMAIDESVSRIVGVGQPWRRRTSCPPSHRCGGWQRCCGNHGRHHECAGQGCPKRCASPKNFRGGCPPRGPQARRRRGSTSNQTRRRPVRGERHLH